ncbi:MULTISPECIES: hypothetical protein [unclassified Dyella]|uniref:hypothetical protein n=1 Tax=unclassified Dyella TaxID=2634549 RepID=UPI003F90A328
MPKKYLAPLVAAALLAACVSMPPVTIRERVPTGSDIAVVMFRDCAITGQEDCDGSGLSAGAIFARVLAQQPGMKAMPLSRPIGPKVQLDDEQAVAYAKAKGFQYVVNGEVVDYYRVAPFTFRTERAGVSVRVLRTSDGQMMAFFSDRTNSGSNLTTPDALIEDMAQHVAASL